MIRGDAVLIERRGVFAVALLSFLSAWLPAAKGKARSFADTAELREFVMAALRRQPDVDRIVADGDDPAQFEVVMDGSPSTGNVTNLFNYLRANPEEDAETIIARFVNTFAETKAAIVNDDNIVAVVRSHDYVNQMVSAGADILHEPLGADLVILYMADRTDSMAPIGRHEVPGKDLATIRKLALDNVRKWLPKVVSDDSLGKGTLYFVEGNPMLSPSLLLLDDFWKSIAPRFPGNALIALPRKDQIFLFDDDGTSAAQAAARRLIDATFEDDFNLLSPLLYARRDGKIVVVPD